MLFLIRLVLISIFGLIGSLYMPWWSIIMWSAIISFLLPGNNFNAFLSGFLGVGLLWLFMAWRIDSQTGGILSSKIAVLFEFSDPNYLIFVSGVIGALGGALGAFTGNSFRQVFVKKEQKSFYS